MRNPAYLARNVPLSGHARRVGRWPLSRVKRTYSKQGAKSACDPKRTIAWANVTGGTQLLADETLGIVGWVDGIGGGRASAGFRGHTCQICIARFFFSAGRRLKEDRDELAGRSPPMRSNSLCVGALARSARTTSAITPTPCRQHTAFRSTAGYLCQLDARQQVSFPDINKDEPKTQTIAPPLGTIIRPRHWHTVFLIGHAEGAGPVGRCPVLSQQQPTARGR